MRNSITDWNLLAVHEWLEAVSGIEELLQRFEVIAPPEEFHLRLEPVAGQEELHQWLEPVGVHKLLHHLELLAGHEQLH